MTHTSYMAELEVELETAKEEVLSLRNTNKRLNRRLSHLDAPFRKEIARVTEERDMWRDSWNHTFHRMTAAHEECKRIYIVCAKVLGLPHFAFHSVMDIHKEEGVYARVIHKYGSEVTDPIRVLDVVKRALKKDGSGTEDTSRFRKALRMCSTKGGVRE